jgi:hypothetical protein
MKNVGLIVKFYKNLHIPSQSQAKKLPAPAPAKCCRSTGSGSATLFVTIRNFLFCFKTTERSNLW